MQLICGSGCTLTTVNQDGGGVTLNSGAATINLYAQTLTVSGSGAVTTLTVYGGTCFWNSTGTLTTLNLYESGTFDVSQDQQAKTITNTVQRFSDSSTLNDPFKVIGSLAVKNNGITDLSKLNIGENLTVTRS